MNLGPRLRSWLKHTLQRSRMESEMEDELRFHIESYAQELHRTGVPVEEAMRRARIEFGSVEAQKQDCRRSLGLGLGDQLRADLSYGFRNMLRSPGFSVVAVLTLALGIGANSAMFGILYGLLYRPLPFADDGRLAMVHLNFAPQNSRRGTLSVADFVDWKNANTAFEQVATYTTSRFTLTGQRQAEEVGGALVSADFFSILRINPILGRTFEPGDDSATAPNQVVIGASLWRRRFGASANAIGQVIEVNGNPATIIGVVNDGIEFPRAQSELWQNLRLKVTRRGPFFYRGIGRLRPGLTLQQAQAETNLIGRNIERVNPGAYHNLTMPVESLRDYLVSDLRPALVMMFAAVMAVLLIAIVNIANLLLARATTREREVAVRLAMGATRGQAGATVPHRKRSAFAHRRGRRLDTGTGGHSSLSCFSSLQYSARLSGQARLECAALYHRNRRDRWGHVWPGSGHSKCEGRSTGAFEGRRTLRLFWIRSSSNPGGAGHRRDSSLARAACVGRIAAPQLCPASTSRRWHECAAGQRSHHDGDP